MLNTEYIRSLNANYERLLLERKPEEKKYQYCMISRGGIKGLLPCSLRYIDGEAYYKTMDHGLFVEYAQSAAGNVPFPFGRE